MDTFFVAASIWMFFSCFMARQKKVTKTRQDKARQGKDKGKDNDKDKDKDKVLSIPHIHFL